MQVYAVLSDIIRRAPDLTARMHRKPALWLAFGLDTETRETERGTVRGAAC